MLSLFIGLGHRSRQFLRQIQLTNVIDTLKTHREGPIRLPHTLCALNYVISSWDEVYEPWWNRNLNLTTTNQGENFTCATNLFVFFSKTLTMANVSVVMPLLVYNRFADRVTLTNYFHVNLRHVPLINNYPLGLICHYALPLFHF